MESCVLTNTLTMVCQKLNDLRRCIILVVVAIVVTIKVNAQCKANFSYAIDFNTGYVTFSNLSTLANNSLAVSYTWYSNPAIVLSNDTNPVIRLKPGLQPICLVVNNAGCIDTFCTSINMPPVHCKARYSYAFDFTQDTVLFSNASSGLNLNYYWSFGDGQYSTELNPKHRFAVNGWYYVCLNVVNTDTTCSDFTCDFVRINRSSPSPCVGNFSFETDTTDSYKVYFTNNTTGDTSITYVWLFGDTTTSSQKNPSHRYDTTGTYKVCLLVSGPNCADSVCKEIEIIRIIPFCKADFTYALFPDSGNNAPRIGVFSNQSTGTNIVYKWIFNETDSSSEASPIHYFRLNGIFKVCLMITSGGLCTDSVCKFISIQTGIPDHYDLSGLVTYPIPIHNVLNIDWGKPLEKDVSLTITDPVGKAQSIGMRKQNTGLMIDTSALPNGWYVLEIRTESESKRIKIIKSGSE